MGVLGFALALSTCLVGPAAGYATAAREKIQELLVAKHGGATHEVRFLVQALGRWWFNSEADDSIGAELWSTRPKTDDIGKFVLSGRPRADAIDAIMLVKDVLPGPAGSYPHDLCEHDGRLYFAAQGEGVGDELFSTGARSLTGADTAMVIDINPGAAGSQPQGLISCGSVLYFGAADPAHGVELWAHRTAAVDGVPAGTALVRDLTPGVAGSAVREMGCNRQTRRLYFSTGAGSSALRWATNGTFDGTEAIGGDEEDLDDPAVQAARRRREFYTGFPDEL